MNVRDKVCTKCGLLKGMTSFHNDKTRVDGKFPQCKACCAELQREYSKTERGKIVKQRARRKYRQTENGIASQKKYESSEKYKAVIKKYTSSAKGKYSRHKWQTSELGRAFYRKYYRNNKLNHSMKTGIGRSLQGNKNGAKWTGLVDYSITELRVHLEKQFKSGMTWSNYGDWHIDHIIPISAFNFTKPEHEDFKRCWALSNLQSLWASENCQKNKKLSKPFQPSLLLENV
jgi:hypothetical protein